MKIIFVECFHHIKYTRFIISRDFKPLLENVNLPLFSQNTAEMMRVLRILLLQLNFIKQGTAKRLTPKARFFLVNGKTHFFTQNLVILVKHFTSKFISCSLHPFQSLPSLQLHPRTGFWSCAAD